MSSVFVSPRQCRIHGSQCINHNLSCTFESRAHPRYAWMPFLRESPRERLRKVTAGSSPSPSSSTKSSSKSRRAVRRVPLRLLYVGKPADASFEHVCDTWAAKVRRYCPFEEVRVKPGGASSAKNASADAQRVEEAGRALKAVGRDSYLFVLDERGKSVSSEHLAKLYAEACDKTSDGVVFAIGGPYGWHDDVRSRAQQTISLSPLVLNHQVARIVTLEALYRSWTILNGEPYHH